MLLNNYNTNSNELLAKRSEAVQTMRNSMEDLMLLLDSMTTGESLDEEVIGSISPYAALADRITDNPLVFTTLSKEDDQVVSFKTKVVINKNVYVGQYYADMKTVFIEYQGELYKILDVTNYKEARGDSPIVKTTQSSYDEFPADKLDELVSSFGCQLASLDLLAKLSRMAAEGGLTKDIALAYINKSEAFISPDLYGMLMSALPVLGPENSVGAMNVVMDNFFYNLKGYGENDGELTFDQLHYEFDDSCLLGFKEIGSIVGQALSIVATIISPILGLVTSVAASAVDMVSNLINRADDSVPQVDMMAVHSIVDRPFDNGILYSPTVLPDMDPWMTTECKATLITGFFKSFAWRANDTDILIEHFPLATKSFNVFSEWSAGRGGDEPGSAMRRIQSLLNYSIINDEMRTIRVVPLSPNNLSGKSWQLPDALGEDTAPSGNDTVDVLWSRLANGLLLASVAVLTALGDRPAYTFSKNSTRPSNADYHELISWWVFQYCNTYYSAIFEGNMATNMVYGWLNDLIFAAGSADERTLLSPWLNDYNVAGKTYQSLYEQGLTSEDPMVISAPIIVAKGVGKLVPPSSRYSLAEKMAVTAAVTGAVVATAAIIGTVAKRSIKKSLAKAQAKAYNAQMAFNSDPSDTNYRALRSANRKYSLKKWLSGASKSTALSNTDLSIPIENGVGVNPNAGDGGLTIQDVVSLISGFKD